MYLYMSNFPWLTMFTRTNGTNRNVYFNMDLLCLYTAFDRFMKFHFYFVFSIDFWTETKSSISSQLFSQIT